METHFNGLKQNLELGDSFKETVSARHNAIRSVLENAGVGIRDTKLIGSVRRKTRIHPRPEDEFDIDILVDIGDCFNWVAANDPSGISAAQALGKVHSTASSSDRYSTKRPTTDAPTITLTFADNVKVELVPALRNAGGVGPRGEAVLPVGRGYWIPQNDGSWMHADYDYEAEHISATNLATGGRLVPAIKMLKAIRRMHIPNLRSFPLEVIAATAVPLLISHRAQNGGGRMSDPELLQLTLLVGKELMKSPLKLGQSNSPAVVLDALTIASASSAFDDVVARIREAGDLTSDAAKVEAWRRIFGDAFPTRV